LVGVAGSSAGPQLIADPLGSANSMCVLRAFGSRFAVDRFVAKTSLPICNVHKRGEPRLPRSKPRGPKHKYSGVTVVVSNAPWSNLQAQIRDAERFLAKHKREIARLSRFPGVEALVLDFPLDLRIGRKTVAQFDHFPATLVRQAGKLGLALELSIYQTGRGR
jgi:hypothetical protein